QLERQAPRVVPVAQRTARDLGAWWQAYPRQRAPGSELLPDRTRPDVLQWVQALLAVPSVASAVALVEQLRPTADDLLLECAAWALRQRLPDVATGGDARLRERAAAALRDVRNRVLRDTRAREYYAGAYTAALLPPTAQACATLFGQL